MALGGCATPRQNASGEIAADAAAQDLQQGADAPADTTADAATNGDTAGSEVEAADSTGEAADTTASTDSTGPAGCVPLALIDANALACGAKPQLPSWATCAGTPTHCKLDVIGPTGLAHTIELDGPPWQPPPRRLLVRVRRVDHLPSGVHLAGQALPHVAKCLRGPMRAISRDPLHRCRPGNPARTARSE